MAIKLSQDDIKKIEQFMTERSLQTVDYFLACHQRLSIFCQETHNALDVLGDKGDLE